MKTLRPIPHEVRQAVRRSVAACRNEPAGRRPADQKPAVHRRHVEVQLPRHRRQCLELVDLDDSIEPVTDGPLKDERMDIPADACPSWPPGSLADTQKPSCAANAGGGWLLPPWSSLQCPECYGLGKVTSADHA